MFIDDFIIILFIKKVTYFHDFYKINMKPCFLLEVGVRGMYTA